MVTAVTVISNLSEYLQALMLAVIVAVVLRMLLPVQAFARSWRPWWIGLMVAFLVVAGLIGRRRR